MLAILREIKQDIECLCALLWLCSKMSYMRPKASLQHRGDALPTTAKGPLMAPQISELFHEEVPMAVIFPSLLYVKGCTHVIGMCAAHTQQGNPYHACVSFEQMKVQEV